MTAMPDSVALTVPEEWADIPLDEGEYHIFIRDKLQELENADLLERADLRQLELVATMGYQVAKANRVILISSFIGIESDNDSDIILMAGVVVSGFRRDEIETDIPLRAELMVEAFSVGTPSDDIGTRYVHIEPPTVCEVAGQKAAKLVRLATAKVGDGQEFKQFTQTYLVSVAEGDAVIVLQFSTINFEFAREFSDLFEAIAQTLRIFYPDDPTFLDDDSNPE